MARYQSTKTYHQRNTLFMRNLGNGLKVGHIVAGVTDSLDIHSLSAIINGSGDILGVFTIDKLSSNTQTREHHLELVIRATVQVGSGDDVIARMRQRGNSHELSRLAGGSCNSSNAALESSNALLKNVDCGVHDSAVNVAEFFEAEEPRAVGGIIESVGCSCVDGDRARIGGRVRLMARGVLLILHSCYMKSKNGLFLPSMKLKGLEVKILLVGHGRNAGNQEYAGYDEISRSKMATKRARDEILDQWKLLGSIERSVQKRLEEKKGGGSCSFIKETRRRGTNDADRGLDGVITKVH